MNAETEMNPSILPQGYIVELADRGPWLKNDGTWTTIWSLRGIWAERDEAEFAIALSLEQKIKP